MSGWSRKVLWKLCPAHSRSLPLLLCLSEDAAVSYSCRKYQQLHQGRGSAGQSEEPPIPRMMMMMKKTCSNSRHPQTPRPPVKFPWSCTPSPVYCTAPQCLHLRHPLHAHRPHRLALSVIQVLFYVFIFVCSGSVSL